MKRLTRNQWIAVVVSLVVIVVFFTTGRDIVSFLASGSATNIDQEAAALESQTASALESQPKNQIITTMDTSFATSISSFQTQDVVVGTGKEAAAGKVIVVNYTGAFTDGRVFDSSIGRGPFEFTLGVGQVIPGWDKGFDGMKVGGKRRLIIPPAFGYGAAGIPGAIPANATLLFEVELLDVK